MKTSLKYIVLALSMCINITFSFAYDIKEARNDFNNGIYEKSIPFILSEAEKGDAIAIGLLGKAYFEGGFFSIDYDKAFDLLNAGVMRDDLESYKSLGNLMLKSEKYNNPIESLRLFTYASDRGMCIAKNNIGRLYLKGAYGVEDNRIDIDYQKSIEWLSKGMECGAATSYKWMGDIYEQALGVTYDGKRATELYMKAAEGGNAEAQYLIGKRYKYGHTVSRDLTKARDWLEKSRVNKNRDGITFFKAELATGEIRDIDVEISSTVKKEAEKLIAEQQQNIQQKQNENSYLLEQQIAAQAEKKNFSEGIAYANRKALVIGNDSYQHVAKLLNAREDARAIAEGLKRVGYQVTLKTDLDQQALKFAIRTFKKQIEGGDEVAIYYAGHGVQLANTNYLLPIDVSGESEDQLKDDAIPLQRILDDISERKAKFTLAMIDACRDNPFKVSGRSIGGTRGLTPTTAATGQMIVFSAGTGQQAMDKLGPNDKDRNGVFTRVFLKQMEAKGLTIDRIFRNVRNEVVGLTKSAGHEQVPAIYDQVVGDFYFNK